MIFVILLAFISLTRLRFPSKPSIAEVLRKRYDHRTLKLVPKFEKTNIKHKQSLLDLQFLKCVKITIFIIFFPGFYVLKSLILIYAFVPHTSDIKQNFYGKRFSTKSFFLVNLTEKLFLLYNNVKSNLNLIDFHHILNILLISNEKELEQTKFKHLLKLKNLIYNFT